MTRESGLFTLARDAFRASLPREAEARAAARRIQRKRMDRKRKRRFAPLLSVAFALVGALAYAAEAARSSEAPTAAQAPASPRAERTTGLAPAKAAIVTPAVRATATSVADSSAALPETSRAEADKPTPKRTPPARERATWSAVARSLASGDGASAQTALERLSASENPRDRGNAALELSRLAAHRNECALARTYLERARANIALSASLERAGAAVERCESRASPAAAVRD